MAFGLMPGFIGIAALMYGIQLSVDAVSQNETEILSKTTACSCIHGWNDLAGFDCFSLHAELGCQSILRNASCRGGDFLVGLVAEPLPDINSEQWERLQTTQAMLPADSG